MPETAVAGLDVAEIAASSLALPRRAEQMLTVLQSRDIEATGTDRAVPPLSPSDLPFPVEELPGWAEYLIPAGYREGFAVALFGPGGRHVGFLATQSGDSGTPPPEHRRALARGEAP
jgi:hypothetical protein